MDALTRQAITAAVQVAERFGLKGVTPALLKDGSNVLMHLEPSPVVARVATTTGWLRQPAETWLRRDLDVAGYLYSTGAPVVPPSRELPPGPHLWTSRDDEQPQKLALSFWTFVQHEPAAEVAAEEAMASLKELHLALRDFPSASLPFMGVVIDEIPHWLKWLEIRRLVSGYDLILLREAQWKLAEILRPGRAGQSPGQSTSQSTWKTQALHGDAHPRNLLRTSAGLVWTDFEDTCKGPVAWDLATLLHQASQSALAAEREREEELLALYPDAPSWRDLQPYLQARELEGVVYMQVLAHRFPERAPEAAARLDAWLRKHSG